MENKWNQNLSKSITTVTIKPEKTAAKTVGKKPPKIKLNEIEQLATYQTIIDNINRISQKYKFATVFFHIIEAINNLSAQNIITSNIYHHKGETRHYNDIYNLNQLKLLLPDLAHILQQDKVKYTKIDQYKTIGNSTDTKIIKEITIKALNIIQTKIQIVNQHNTKLITIFPDKSYIIHNNKNENIYKEGLAKQFIIENHNTPNKILMKKLPENTQTININMQIYHKIINI